MYMPLEELCLVLFLSCCAVTAGLQRATVVHNDTDTHMSVGLDLV